MGLIDKKLTLWNAKFAKLFSQMLDDRSFLTALARDREQGHQATYGSRCGQ